MDTQTNKLIMSSVVHVLVLIACCTYHTWGCTDSMAAINSAEQCMEPIIHHTANTTLLGRLTPSNEHSYCSLYRTASTCFSDLIRDLCDPATLSDIQIMSNILDQGPGQLCKPTPVYRAYMSCRPTLVTEAETTSSCLQEFTSQIGEMLAASETNDEDPCEYYVQWGGCMLPVRRHVKTSCGGPVLAIFDAQLQTKVPVFMESLCTQTGAFDDPVGSGAASPWLQRDVIVLLLLAFLTVIYASTSTTAITTPEASLDGENVTKRDNSGDDDDEDFGDDKNDDNVTLTSPKIKGEQIAVPDIVQRARISAGDNELRPQIDLASLCFV